MAARAMQPSEYEIKREVEALRDIRRRSAAPGALVMDPDLPNHSPPGSPTYWAPGSTIASPLLLDGDSSSSSHEGSSVSDLSSGRNEASSNTADSSGTPNNPADDPSHLFWVPASLHPEIAPAEFRAFLKEHARSPPNSDASDSPQRSNSVSSSSSLARKSSMLSRQYKPRENDGVEEENVVPLRRNRSSFYADRVPQFTMDDLQRLEELAEEATESDDPSKLRTMLRRSLSVNASALDRMDDMPEMTDEADSPIIIPPPGQILRRTARTKIRKPGLPGDGGGHRFGASRRGVPNRTVSVNETRTSSDFSASDHGDIEPSSLQRRQTFSDDGSGGSQRPDSFSEEIYDAYRTRYSEEEEKEEMPLPLIMASPVELQPAQPPQEPPTPSPISEIKPELLEALGPVLHQPQPQRLLVPTQNEIQGVPSRSPSPSAPSMPSLYNPPTDSSSTISTAPSFLSTTPSPPSHQQNRRDKDKSSKKIFKWGSDKGGKKGKEDSGFFVSLFGGKKKQDDPPPLGGHGVNAGREAAHALLGASKSSKAYTAPPSPGLAPGIGGPNSYARYPIHVERAIYRLSHIKLANPRRPLYEQVLISNLMFWYLGVINKAQSPQQTAGQGGPNGTATPTMANGSEGGGEKEDGDDERREMEQREQREKLERERLDRERLEKEQREKEAMELRKKESGRKGSLTKTGGPASAGRRAEMPIRGPQYEMQHRVMEQEYHGGQPQQPTHMGRPPQVNGVPGQQFPRQQQQQPPSPYGNVPPGQPRLMQSQQQPGSPDQFYYSGDVSQQRLPPGAMLPAEKSQWTPQAGIPPKRSTHSSVSPPSTPVPQRRSRSPPPQGYMQQQPMNMAKINSSQDNLVQSSGGAPGIRQHAGSFSAVSHHSPPQANGRLKKQNSANAVIPGPPRRPHTSEGRPGYNREEEDVPLAVWQQQRRK